MLNINKPNFRDTFAQSNVPLMNVDTKASDVIKMIFAARGNDMQLVMQSDPSLSKFDGRNQTLSL